MSRFDRILAILLLLRGGRGMTAAEMARRLEVSTRTVYRDVETLSALGVPVYAARGQGGGFRLLPGYFLPPVTFSQGEAISLLLGLALLRSLRATPFAAQRETAEHKLLAAVPDALRAILAHAQQVIAVEAVPRDAFHPKRAASHDSSAPAPPDTSESAVVEVYLQAVLERTTVHLRYGSPYRAAADTVLVDPAGLFWDRDHWYLVGTVNDMRPLPRLWRADRVLAITPHSRPARIQARFDIRDYLGRGWLRTAMMEWTEQSPVSIRLSRRQAERLQQDWYYGHASFRPLAADEVLMTFGEDDRGAVLALLRWLGPGAELIAPKEWRAVIRDEVLALYHTYAADAYGHGHTGGPGHPPNPDIPLPEFDGRSAI